MVTKTVLITGAAGFIGHHLVETILKETDWGITIIDRLDESGNLNRLAEIGAAKNSRVRFVYHDLRAPINALLQTQIGRHDYILHLAAATHVDRSIDDPMAFVLDNVVATCNILDLARKSECTKFVQFSTDEVFGPAPVGTAYKEWDRYKSGNPYAATKAGAEELALSYHNTYGLPVIITHTMNVIGERQHPEKFVPSTISKILKGEEVVIHANTTCTIPGSRFYIHAKEVAKAILFLLQTQAKTGDKYNIVGERELDNLQIVELISKTMKKPFWYRMVDFHSSRPGHDLRYALDGTKMKQLGWAPSIDIESSIKSIVEWTLSHPEWVTIGGKSEA